MGIASCTVDGKIVAVNETFCEMLERSQDALTNTGIEDLLLAADRQTCQKLFEPEAKDAESGPTELRFVHSNGSIVWTEVEFAPVGGADGHPDYFVAVIRNLTDAKRAETEISRLGRIVDESFNEVYIIDSETFRFRQVNRSARRNLRFSSRELTEMTPVDINPEFTLDTLRAHVEPLYAGKVDHIEFESKHRRKNGSEYPIRVHLQLSEVDDPPLLVEIVTDLSERKEAESRLRQAQKMEAIGQLAGGIAHDFNNVLTVISGNLSLLSRELAGEFPDKDWDELLDDAISAANRARDLTKGLLSVSRKEPMVRADVDVDSVIDEVQNLLRRTLPPNISISVETHPGSRFAFTDENQLHTALLNLGLNARDAMPEGGSVRSRLRCRW